MRNKEITGIPVGSAAVAIFWGSAQGVFLPGRGRGLPVNIRTKIIGLLKMCSSGSEHVECSIHVRVDRCE